MAGRARGSRRILAGVLIAVPVIATSVGLYFGRTHEVPVRGGVITEGVVIDSSNGTGFSLLPAFADAPAQPNCLGRDSAAFAQSGIPAFGVSSGSGFGQFHLVLAQTGAPGVGDEILAHLQGVTPVSGCPDNGFPSPFPRP